MLTAQEWVDTLSKHSALLEAGASRRRGASDAACRARSPSPGRPSQGLPATKSLHPRSPSVKSALFLLMVGVLYDAGLLEDVITVLKGGTPTVLQRAEPDHYEVLQLELSATVQDVKKAFRERSKDTHPDRCAADAVSEVCGEIAQHAVNRAHEVLSDSSLRREYDSTRKTSFAEKLNAVAQLVTACSRGEISPVLGLVEFASITGVGFGSALWLTWLVSATPWMKRLIAQTATVTLVSAYLGYSLYLLYY
jgi:hypothetical protein